MPKRYERSRELVLSNINGELFGCWPFDSEVKSKRQCNREVVR
jgi:hypothetical protein